MSNEYKYKYEYNFLYLWEINKYFGLNEYICKYDYEYFRFHIHSKPPQKSSTPWKGKLLNLF